jgi:CubicO group peptidase (beta-lactamase class C family)
MKIKLFLAGLVFAATIANAQSQSDTIDRYLQHVQEKFDAPGCALAVVENGEIVYSNGFGTRTIGKNEKIDGNTMFAIGSISKSITVASLAILVDEGKVNWDDKVITYLPYFKLYDPYVTAHFSIRDLLTHQSGLPSTSGGTLWYHSDRSRREVVEGLQYLKPSDEYRGKPAYQNVMFLVVALIVEEVSGQNWDEFVKERIFEPVGMKNTVTLQKQRRLSDNITTPHVRDNEANYIAIEQEKMDNLGPAGSIYSSSNDMANYMLFVLGHGIYKGDTIISPEVFEEILKPQKHFVISESRQNEFTSYGLGWWLTPKRNYKVIEHSGGVDGAGANLMMVDDTKFGFIVMMNCSGNILTSVVTNELMGNYLNDEGHMNNSKWLHANSDIIDSLVITRHQEFLNSQIQGTSSSLDEEEYCGTYNDVMYGDVIVEMKKGKMQMIFTHTDLFSGTLTHWHYNTFRLGDRDPRIKDALITFKFNSSGDVIGFEIDQPRLLDVDFDEVNFEKVSITAPKPH